MRAILVLMAMAVGCGARGVANDQPDCTFDLVVPVASAKTCSAKPTPFDVALDVATVGHVATTFSGHDYSVIAGERINLAVWSIVELDGQPCTKGIIDIDALPPHWVVSFNAQCGTTPISGVAYGDM